MLDQRGKAYSHDLRERVFAASDDGERVGEIAQLLRVSVAYVSKALTRRRTTGETTASGQCRLREPRCLSRLDRQPHRPPQCSSRQNGVLADVPRCVRCHLDEPRIMTRPRCS